MPHVEESVAEVIRALDDLNVDGVVLLANNFGTYLGQDGQDDLWAALDARSAVVFIHPAQRPGSSEPTAVRARRRGPHRHAGRRQVDQTRDMTAARAETTSRRQPGLEIARILLGSVSEIPSVVFNSWPEPPERRCH